MEIGPVSYPDSLFASCGRLPYPYADRSRHVWNPSPSLVPDARVSGDSMDSISKGCQRLTALWQQAHALIADTDERLAYGCLIQSSPSVGIHVNR
ncbi:MAG: hypothetical protein IIT76_02765, partial [Prevotella sp.]|nr:hypothetical protein [Prevotella sp.]